MDATQRAIESHLVGHAWIKRRFEDPAVLSIACGTVVARSDRVTLSERVRQVEPTSETGASRR